MFTLVSIKNRSRAPCTGTTSERSLRCVDQAEGYFRLGLFSLGMLAEFNDMCNKLKASKQIY